MAKVIITKDLEKEINRIIKKESIDIFELMLTLENNPKNGKEVGNVGAIIVREIKYKKYRFYFITEGYKVKFLKIDELKDLIIKFVRMSDKNTQKKTINEIKNVLRKLDGFEF